MHIQWTKPCSWHFLKINSETRTDPHAPWVPQVDASSLELFPVCRTCRPWLAGAHHKAFPGSKLSHLIQREPRSRVFNPPMTMDTETRIEMAKPTPVFSEWTKHISALSLQLPLKKWTRQTWMGYVLKLVLRIHWAAASVSSPIHEPCLWCHKACGLSIALVEGLFGAPWSPKLWLGQGERWSVIKGSRIQLVWGV